MKKLLIILLACSFTSVFAQDTIKVKAPKVIIQAVNNSEWSHIVPFPGPDVLYIGMSNLVKLTVPAKYKGYTISMPNGAVEPKGKDLYEVRIMQGTGIKMTVLFKGKEVGSKEFKVQKVPMPGKKSATGKAAQ